MTHGRTIIGALAGIALALSAAPARAFGPVDPCKISCYIYLIACCPKPCPVVKMGVLGNHIGSLAAALEMVTSGEAMNEATQAMMRAIGAEGRRLLMIPSYLAMLCKPAAPRTFAAATPQQLSLSGLTGSRGTQRDNTASRAAVDRLRVTLLNVEAGIATSAGEHVRLMQAANVARDAIDDIADLREGMRLLATYRALSIAAQAVTKSTIASRLRVEAPRYTNLFGAFLDE